MTAPIFASSASPRSDDCWWLALADVGGVGWKTYADLLDRFGSPEGALRALADGTAKAPRVDRARAAAVCRDIDHYRALVRRCGELGISVVHSADAVYPHNLRSLDQKEPPAPRPPFLYMRGQYQESDERCAALVGSLTPSPEGVKRAKRLAKLLVQNGFTVVSGLARGIDTASHTGALEAGGRTIAVVGTGLDTVYPPENAELAAQIEGRGAVFSQFALGVGPQKHTFPMRNQVMSGISLATIIVEGHAKCGSLIQADFAFQQGRQVYLLKSNLDQPDNAWAKDLVEKGAVVVGEIDDVLSTIRPPLAPSQPVQGPLLRSAPNGAPSAAVTVKTTGGSAAPAVAVLFDLEGTLYDAAAAMTEAYRHVLRESYGVSVSAEALAPLLSGSPYMVFGKWLAKGDVRAANALYGKVYPNYFAQCGCLFDGVAELIEQLHNQGYQMGIVTSQTRSRVKLVLSRFPALAAAAEVLVAWDDVGSERKKPNPYPIELAIKRLNIRPATVYYVGDGLSDMQAGRSAGAKTVAVSWGLTPLDVLMGEKPDHAIRSIAELSGIVGKG